MISRKQIKVKRPEEVEVGSLLVAQPFWQDIKYKRSVIILLNHDNLGSTGIILNKQTTLNVKDALPSLNKNMPLYYGGPFDTHTISYFHNNADIPETVQIANDIYWGGNFEYLQQVMKEDGFQWNKIRFFAGFVEWSAGQLQAEIRESKWWTTELKSDELFTNAVDELWSYELLSSGHTYGLLNDYPDPSLN